MPVMQRGIFMSIKTNKLAILLIFTLLLTSCSKTVPNETNRLRDSGESSVIVPASDTTASAEKIPTMDLSQFDQKTDSDDAVKITMSATSAVCDGEGVSIGDGRITITDAGSYRLTGDYSGRILVEAGADDNIHLILSSVNIAGTMAPIYISNCKNAVITLASGTLNSVSDSQDYTFSDGEDEPDAVIYSDCDLTINGEGSLTVTGNYACGIRTKDDLRILGGDICVSSVGDAVKGRDSVRISGGTFRIDSEADGVKSNNDEDAAKGFVLIEGGDFFISAGDDAIHAESRLIVNGGNITVFSSYEGLEGRQVEINGGTLDITASDDALNAASPSTDENSENAFDPQNNRENMPQKGADRGGFGGANLPGGMPEMPENMTPPDEMEFHGEVTEPGAGWDDRGNRSGHGDKGGLQGNGSDRNEGFGKMFGGGMMNEMPEDGVWIRISGGNIRLSGGNDVLDSNGTIEITGGSVLIDNARMSIYGSPDGVFDANGSTSVTAGSCGFFAQNAGSADRITECPYISVQTKLSAGTSVEVTDNNNHMIFSGSIRTGGSVFFLTSDQLVRGEEYTLRIGERTETVTAQ